MMVFLTEDELDDAIRKICAEPKVDCAVAFWGQGAQSLFPDREKQAVRVLCNLASGGTNPQVIEEFRNGGVEVRQNNQLHAKIYIGSEHAIVTSANASANGLGFEGDERRWVEAGVRVSDRAPVAKWFAQYWESGDAITDANIKAAMETWRRRQKAIPSIESPRAMAEKAAAERSKRLVRAFRTHPPTATDLRVIQALLDNPGATSHELSEACDSTGGTWHLLFGKMCKLRQGELRPAQSGPDGRYTKLLANLHKSGIRADLEKDPARFTMRPEVVAGFAELGIHPRQPA